MQRAEDERHTIQKHKLLHFHAHDLQPNQDQFRIPLYQNGTIQDEMKIERLGIMCYGDVPIGPGAWFG